MGPRWCPRPAGFQVVQDNLNPVWNEYFEFVLEGENRLLTLTVKDDDRVGKNVELGSGELFTGELAFAPNTIVQRTFEFQHKGKPAGSLDAEFEYRPFADQIDKEYFDHDLETKAIGALFIDVVRGRDLAKDHTKVRVSQQRKLRHHAVLVDTRPKGCTPANPSLYAGPLRWWPKLETRLWRPNTCLGTARSTTRAS
jgi:Ca2+-dependent lipid-binding protein